MADDDYDVGYGKPPKHGQFKKGQSGNPRGRPKGTLNFKTDLEEELQEDIRITEGGKTEVVSKQKAIVKRTAEKALKGDLKAISMITQWVMQYFGMPDEPINIEDLSQEDRTIIDQFVNSEPDLIPPKSTNQESTS